ncbi:MAG: YidH family protein [Nitriliruptorales bacterium]
MSPDGPQYVEEADLRSRENVGSVARDHLANERTYLAWLRTGFGTAALGLGVATLLQRPNDVRPTIAGVLFVLLGIFMLLYATMRYYKIMRALDEGMMHVSRTGPILFGFVSAVVAIAVVVLVLA